MYFFLCWMRYAIVCFVDIGGIVEHHYLNFLFTIGLALSLQIFQNKFLTRSRKVTN